MSSIQIHRLFALLAILTLVSMPYGAGAGQTTYIEESTCVKAVQVDDKIEYFTWEELQSEVKRAGAELDMDIDDFIGSRRLNGVSEADKLLAEIFEIRLKVAERLKAISRNTASESLKNLLIEVSNRISEIDDRKMSRIVSDLDGKDFTTLSEKKSKAVRNSLSYALYSAWGRWAEVVAGFSFQEMGSDYGVRLRKILPNELKIRLIQKISTAEVEYSSIVGRRFSLSTEQIVKRILDVEIDIVSKNKDWLEIKNSRSNNFRFLDNPSLEGYASFYLHLERLRFVQSIYVELGMTPPKLTYAFFGSKVSQETRDRLQSLDVEVLEFP